MGECQDCGAVIGDKYIVCVPCLKKRNVENKEVEEHKVSGDVVRELGKLNNNLYALRTIQEHILVEKFEKKLVWNKEEKRFDINDIDKIGKKRKKKS